MRSRTRVSSDRVPCARSTIISFAGEAGGTYPATRSCILVATSSSLPLMCDLLSGSSSSAPPHRYLSSCRHPWRVPALAQRRTNQVRRTQGCALVRPAIVVLTGSFGNCRQSDVENRRMGEVGQTNNGSSKGKLCFGRDSALGAIARVGRLFWFRGAAESRSEAPEDLYFRGQLKYAESPGRLRGPEGVHW